MLKQAKQTVVLTGIFILGSSLLYSQDPIKKEVKVVKPYEPSLSDAFKITHLPILDDTLHFTPEYNYTITPRSFSPEYNLRPIRPAKLMGETLPKLYNSMLKLGFGNYWTPYGELSINNLRSKEHSYGVYAKHISSQGKVLLENDKKVFGGYGNSEVDLYGKKIMKNSILSGNIGLQSDQIYYYGYDTDTIIVPDSLVNDIEKEDIKQSFLLLEGNIRLRSAHVDSNKFAYDMAFGYNHFRDKFDMAENGFSLDSRFSKLFGKQYLGTNLAFHYRDKSEGVDSTYNALLNVAPWFLKRSSQWKLQVGLSMTFDMIDGNTTPYFYPQVELQFKVVENLLFTYLGVDGGLEMNHYQKISMENPFVVPGLAVKNSDRNLHVYGGFLGSISNKTTFKIKASYTLIDDMYFFVNDTIGEMRNQFIVEYDDVELKALYGEVETKPTEKLSFILKGNYYGYSMSSQDKPWHKPTWDITFSAGYNLRNKILLSADLFGEGKRYAKTYGIPGNTVKKKLDGLLDINLGLEYRYTKLLSGFINFYNITSARYARWNQYPSQQLFFLVGFTYAM